MIKRLITFFVNLNLVCECNRHAKTCHDRTGKCNCKTKGIIGDKCDKCDRQNHYYGDPVKDSCFCKSISFPRFLKDAFVAKCILLSALNILTYLIGSNAIDPNSPRVVVH